MLTRRPRKARSARIALPAVALLVVAALMLAGCARPATADRDAATQPVVNADALILPATVAPHQPYAVGVRRLYLRRTAERPLPTFVWYPVLDESADGLGTPWPGASPAPGRFPVVLFSHGLGGLPDDYLPLVSRWVAAGFVVAAAQFPRTNRHFGRSDRDDVRHQPADGAFVLAEVCRLDVTAGDPLAGRLDTSRLAATGFSAGGFTTSGMFVPGRDRRLRSAVVIAAGAIDGGAFTGLPAPVLFVHGTDDRTVTYPRARTAHDRLRWPKAFLTLHGQGHGEYLTPGVRGYEQVARTTTDFLRWTLLGDTAARQRLARDGNLPSVATLADRL
jgi:dienelactone hydrolase